MKHLLDTNICIPLMEATDPALAARVFAAHRGSVVLCSVVRAELEFSARKSSRVAENLTYVTRFCKTFESLPFDDEAAAICGDLRAHLKRTGQPIGSYDEMIAAIAIANELTLVTRNIREFQRVPGLTIERW
jgi:tRNA(fMet)-specific endonuclease VapC